MASRAAWRKWRPAAWPFAVQAAVGIASAVVLAPVAVHRLLLPAVAAYAAWWGWWDGTDPCDRWLPIR